MGCVSHSFTIRINAEARDHFPQGIKRVYFYFYYTVYYIYLVLPANAQRTVPVTESTFGVCLPMLFKQEGFAPLPKSVNCDFFLGWSGRIFLCLIFRFIHL